MSFLGLDIYEIDFFILDNNNPKTLVIFDQSHYLDNPEKPIYSIKLPGYNTYVTLPYVINQINVLNSNLLGLTHAFCHDDLSDLPDGVYEIIQSVCPYDTLFKKQFYLKTTKLSCKYDKLLLDLDLHCKCVSKKELESELISIDILIQSAKAEVSVGNVEKGQEKYLCASEKIDLLNKKLKCS